MTKDLNISRELFYKEEEKNHEETVLNLKNAMAEASLDFYKCYNPQGNTKVMKYEY